KARRVEVQSTADGGTRYTLARTERGWQLSSPAVERLDPDKKNTLLEALADLWAERFVTTSPGDVAAAVGAPALAEAGLASAFGGAAWAAQAGSREWLLFRTGLDKPERTLRVQHDNGQVTLLIGKVSGTRSSPRPANPLAPAEPPGGGTTE